MLVSIPQGTFSDGLSSVSRAVSARNTLPVLSGILLKASEGRIVLRATDTELSIECAVPGTVHSEGSVVLPSRFLTDLVRRIPFGEVTVSVEDQNNMASIRWGKSAYSIHGFSEDQFPEKTSSAQKVSFSLPQRFLKELVRQTAFSVSHDDTRPYLTGVNFILDGNKLRAIATDSIRIAVTQVSIDQQTDGTANAIIPGKSLSELGRLLSAESSAEVRVGIGDNHSQFELGDTTLVSRLFEGNYPDVMRLVPGSYGTRASIPTEAFVEAVERAALLAKEGAVKLSILPSQLTITANTPEVGQVYEEVSCAAEGSPLEIGLNSRLLLEGLRPLESDEFVFEFSGNRSPCRVKAASPAEYCYILLPLITY